MPSLNSFFGEIPRLDDRKLPEGFASRCDSARFERGTLAAFHGQLSKQTYANARVDFIQHLGFWLRFDDPVNAALGPVRDERLYVTGFGAPKVYLPDADPQQQPGWRTLALQAPTTPPTVAIDAAGTSEDDETIVYVYTFVTDLDEESAPSGTATITRKLDETVNLTAFAAAQAERGIDRIRIYRSQTGATGVTSLLFAVELPISTTQWQDDPSVTILAEPISTVDFAPLDDDAEGLTAMPNGMMAAFKDRTLYFCQPYQPHAWPEIYELVTDYKIMGLAAFGTTLVVTTEGTPYVVQGSDPSNLVMDRLEHNLPCVAKRGVVDMGYSAVYPSHEGLVEITQSGVRNITEALFTREDWQELQPDTFIGSQYRGQYIFSYEEDKIGTRKTGIIDLRGAQPYFVRDDFSAVALRHDIKTGELFGLVAGNDIQQWDDPDTLIQPYLWKSGEIHSGSPVSFGAFRIEGRFPSAISSPLCTVRIFADGKEIRNKADCLNQTFRLPREIASTWVVEVSGNATVTKMSLAGSVSDLAMM